MAPAAGGTSPARGGAAQAGGGAAPTGGMTSPATLRTAASTRGFASPALVRAASASGVASPAIGRAGSSGVATSAAAPSSGAAPVWATAPFLGRDGVPQLGLGMAAIGRPGYINVGHGGDLGAATQQSVEAMRSNAFTVLDAAWAAGVRRARARTTGLLGARSLCRAQWPATLLPPPHRWR